MDFLSRVLDAVATHLEIPRSKLDEIEYEKRLNDGADRHYIASATAMDRAKRNAEIARDLKAGATIPQIAERRGMTRQQIWNIAQDLAARQLLRP